MSSSYPKNVIAGSLALLAAFGWNNNQRLQQPKSYSKATTLLFDVGPLALATLGTWWLLKAGSNIKVGITHKLGISLPVEPECSDKITYRRRLGLLERWYVAHSRTGMHTGFSIALELEPSPGLEPPSLDDMRQILTRVSNKFPWLRAKVKRDGVAGIDSRESLTEVNGALQQRIWGDDLYLEISSPLASTKKSTHDLFDLREATLPVGLDPKEGLQRILEEEGAKEWHDNNPESPLWRATLVKETGGNFMLVLSFHHLIVDGIGATSVAQAIIDESSAVSFKVDTPLDTLETISPPMEDMVDTVPTIRHLLIPVLLDMFPSLTPYLKPPHWQGLTDHKNDKSVGRQSQMSLCSMIMDGDQLSRACQRMNVTVNSLCVATLCRAIAVTSGEKDAKSKVNLLKVQIAKNERCNCDLLPSDLGAYLSGPQVYVSAPTASSIESIAYSFQRKLYASFHSAAMDIGLCKFISQDWIEFARKFAKQEPNGIHDSLEFSNLGKVQLKGTNADWKLQSFWFSQGRRETGAAITVTVARNREDGSEIQAVLSSFPQAVSREMLEQISRAWEKEMKCAIGM